MRSLQVPLWSIVAMLLCAAGCGPVCDSSNICAVTGRPPNEQLCDGNDFRSCGDGNRGQVVDCGEHSAKQAVCSPNGWVFENAVVPDGG